MSLKVLVFLARVQLAEDCENVVPICRVSGCKETGVRDGGEGESSNVEESGVANGDEVF